ncbi:TIGR02594 family protein [Agrobacterium sp. CNPSo 3708]|uniref:NlpC/P60 family protein n=1 Tax=Agrobacterium sp. CNPSo 3708 TaxID=3028150 RepID=UPI0023647EC4|nr:TIGR02594 family protein [Agrobacterium sp. CNPSo 3708]MDD1498998.1 TIGR02594 family protein [Agrobacterium sp. CNPSo 3708]
MSKIIEIQKALAARGLKPGPLDGIWGRQTISAIKIFQATVGLKADGILGPLTIKALLPDAKPSKGLDRTELVWLKEAQRLLGTREQPGSGSNPEILDWATDVNTMYKSDDIPWCGLFVGHCIGSTLPDEPLPSGLLRARSWSRFGIPTLPTPGAVMVFWRKSKQSDLGHVGFYAGEDDSAYRILGGNQSDKVSYTWVARDRFLSARWPATVPPAAPEVVEIGRKENMSWDEA